MIAVKDFIDISHKLYKLTLKIPKPFEKEKIKAHFDPATRFVFVRVVFSSSFNPSSLGDQESQARDDMEAAADILKVHIESEQLYDIF